MTLSRAPGGGPAWRGPVRRTLAGVPAVPFAGVVGGLVAVVTIGLVVRVLDPRSPGGQVVGFLLVLAALGVLFCGAAALFDRLPSTRAPDDDVAAPAVGTTVWVAASGAVSSAGRRVVDDVTLASDTGIALGRRRLTERRVLPADGVLALELRDGRGAVVAAAEAFPGPAHVDWFLRSDGRTARVRTPRRRRAPRRRTFLTDDGRAWVLVHRHGGMRATVPDDLSDAGLVGWLWFADRVGRLVPVPDVVPRRARVRRVLRRGTSVLTMLAGVTLGAGAVLVPLLLDTGRPPPRELHAFSVAGPLFVLAPLVLCVGALVWPPGGVRGHGHRAGIEGRTAVLLPRRGVGRPTAVVDDAGRVLGELARVAGVWTARVDGHELPVVRTDEPVADAGTPTDIVRVGEHPLVAELAVVGRRGDSDWTVRLDAREVRPSPLREAPCGVMTLGTDAAGGCWRVGVDGELRTLVVGVPDDACAVEIACWAALAHARRHPDRLRPRPRHAATPGPVDAPTSVDVPAPRDAGPRDAGPRDAGPRDAGLRDAGPVGAGIVDGDS